MDGKARNSYNLGAMKDIRRKKVFVAMSGGVDSSVAALLLSGSARSREARKRAGLPAGRQGYDVVGVFMRCYNVDGCAERDAEDARRVAEKLGIPFYVWDFEEEYKRKVVDYMVRGYKRGETPNPDVMCNREVKFGLFLERALRMGADFVATGHYVIKRESRIQKAESRKKPLPAIYYSLHIARDKNKDQSYFLWTLSPEQLKHCLFPIGEYPKPEVRRIARRAGLPTADKKDSQGICFLGQVSLTDFLKSYLPEKRGAVVGLKGEKLGEHSGAHFYTIGQRQGIGNVKHEKGMHVHAPLYVAKKDVRRNTVTVAEGAENPALFRREAKLKELNLIGGPLRHTNKLEFVGMSLLARVRYRQPLTPAKLEKMQNTRKNKIQNWRLVFDQPQKFVAPGQSAVFYSKTGEMLGGGVIS